MQLLEERINKDGIVKEGNVLKVDSFLNHQIDVNFVCELGKEFYRLFKDFFYFFCPVFGYDTYC